MHSYFEDNIAEMEKLLTENNQRGFSEHLKGAVGTGGEKAVSEQYVRDEDGALLRDKVRIRKRWAGFSYRLLDTKSLALDPTIIELFPKRPLALPHGDEPAIDEMTGVVRSSMPNWKVAGPDSLAAELLKLHHPEFTHCFHSILANIGKTGYIPQQRKFATVNILHRKMEGFVCNNYEGISHVAHAGKVLSKIAASRLSSCRGQGGILPEK